ncbi:MAG: pectate lyase, partial [Alistipes sp.]|nr:pectate lyase [Alistipes sp.]
MKSLKLTLLLTLVVALCSPMELTAQRLRVRSNLLRETRTEFFQTDEARRVGDQVLLFQRTTGGWPKNTDMSSRMTDMDVARVKKEQIRIDDSTIDNGATTMQMLYLARLYQATGDERYRDGFRRGLDYLLDGQYENGGWPQVWPNTTGYRAHITFNDDAIVNILEIFDDIRNGLAPYEGDLIDKEQRKRVEKAFKRAIECILKCQIYVDGKPTVWCQQHYKDTYAPAPARVFEHASYCTQESAGLVRLLMSLPNPDKRIKA